MKKYKQLINEQRYQIYGLRQAGLGQTQIAQKVGLDKHVYAGKWNERDLCQHLRGQKPYLKRYASGQERRGVTKNRISIDGSPEIVDRKTRYVLAGHIRSKYADGVTAVTMSLLMPRKDKCHTITLDNGRKFAGHEIIAAELRASVYFAHPYSSRERGLNKNSNGPFRQYFPTGTDLTDVTDEQVQRALERLSYRPRKVLGRRSPHEVLSWVEMRYIKPPLAVALRT